MNENSTNLWNKNVNDMTVGDAVKLNGYILGATCALGALWIGSVTAVDKLGSWRQSRKDRKNETNES